MSVVDRVLDLVFPPICPACDDPIMPKQSLCERCDELVEDNPLGGAIRAPFLYGGPIADALRQLKFHGRREIARTLAPRLAQHLAPAARDCQVIVPVPLSRTRLFTRGYNQAELLARFAGRLIDLPVEAGLLRRIRATSPQTGLDRAARQRNVAGAFAAGSGRAAARLAGRTVVLFDDVATTGATLHEAAEALRRAGCGRIVRFAAARAES